MNSVAHAQSTSGGLNHLMEAATALTKLVDTCPFQSEKLAPSERGVVSDDDATADGSMITSKPCKSAREIFPERLMAILSDPSLSDTIAWLPHGRSFVIIRPDVFAEQVLPKYLPSTDPRASTKYPSFTRKLNRWGFRQATRGPDAGAFHHPLFRRDEPERCLDMVCQKTRKRSVKSTESLVEHKKTAESALPPKKRKVHSPNQSPPLTSEALQTLGKSHRIVSSATLSTVSADDQSISSNTTVSAPSSPTTIATTVNNAPLHIMATRPTAALSPLVSTDPALVASSLKAREDMERLSAAKAMLFDAYIKALHGQ